MYSSFGWRSSTIAPSALAPLQTLQPWLLCCCRWILLEACAVVTTHQHSKSDALGQLWGSFRRHRKHSASGHYQRYCLCAIQPLCSCSASLVQPRSIRCPYQRHVYADHLCSKLTARVYAVTTQKLMQSKGKKSIRSFNLIHGMNWNNLRMALLASIESHLKKGMSCLCLMLVA